MIHILTAIWIWLDYICLVTVSTKQFEQGTVIKKRSLRSLIVSLFCSLCYFPLSFLSFKSGTVTVLIIVCIHACIKHKQEGFWPEQWMCLTIKNQNNHLKYYQVNSVILRLKIFILRKTIILTVLVLLKLIEIRKFYYLC